MTAPGIAIYEGLLATSAEGLLSSSRVRVPQQATVSASLLSGTHSLGMLILPSGNRLYVEAEPDAPAWVAHLLAKVNRLVELPEDWDSYGAPPIREPAVFGALELLAQITSSDSACPQVVPTSQGGLQLEWHEGGVDLEVEVSGAGAPSVYYLNSQTGVEWESTNIGSSAIAELVPTVQ